ncbi:DUF1624 domain-containing protein [Nitratireductor mangrovi]|uniref:DUF1624 domain-containing protein n=1 Tax=Nitratireductor mangrovi TaxID=2599600 RepID=A0A5B8L417_9HYPH|nr:heparan-alpha-glucosaminide N-acetyltransferase [Nitratireductor mangrovi]QDZ02553.1 DUF1624 domain-containing protein [Nitratireductor mangrovi]
MAAANLMTRAVTSTRIASLDVARGAALLAMAVYHFTWDLEFFGYAEPGLTAAGGWKYFARAIASSFLGLAGVSLFLAHARGVRWSAFGRRLAMIVAAAAAITLATYFAMPDAFIFFGILHQIALASLLGLFFLRLPWWATAVAAAAFITAAFVLRTPLLDHPAWWWTGLSQALPRSNDYVPVFPWFGAVLAGIALAQLAARAGALKWLAERTMPRWTDPLALAGRHSLAVYLVHQPVLIASVFLFSQVFPAQTETPQVQVRLACEDRCRQDRGEEFCAFYCVCVLDRIEAEGLLGSVLAGRQDGGTSEKLAGFARVCTADTERLLRDGEDE